LSKLKVSDMAGEFGIPTDDVMSLLRQMDVPVRGPTSMLSDDQVARIRARWEREKRQRADKASAAAAPARRRRAPAEVAAATAASESDAPAKPAKVAKAKTAKASKVAAAAPAPAAEAAPSGVRRRKRADIASPVDEVVAEAAVAPPETFVEVEPSESYSTPDVLDEPVVESTPAVLPPREPPRETPRDFMRDANSPAPTTHSAGGTPTSPGRPRPRPITPGAPRPRPVASSSAFMPPRPVASATPGGAGNTARRDDRKPGGGPPSSGGGGGAGTSTDRGRRRKGKRGAVDQGAIDASVSKTLAAMRGGPQRRTASDMRREVREGREAGIAEAAEREKKIIRVNEFITVSELAQILKLPATEIVGFAFKNM
jgi:translation initiation factor IF-2